MPLGMSVALENSRRQRRSLPGNKPERSTTMRLLGIIFVILGVLALVYQGFSMVIPTEVVDLPFFKIAVFEDRYIPLPPIVGIVLLVAGVAMIAAARDVTVVDRTL